MLFSKGISSHCMFEYEKIPMNTKLSFHFINNKFKNACAFRIGLPQLFVKKTPHITRFT